MPRDEFSLKTKEMLAKRVGFLCSNPSCRKHTVGPNSNPEKAVLIGKAAHITAASKNGPRFDENLDILQRKHINNGIWLCSNCADLIDKDEYEYPVSKLNKWKDDAVNEMRLKISGESQIVMKPNVDIDLIWQFGGRWNNGLSPKNEYEYIKEYNGYLIKTDPPIIFWELSWNFKLVVFNNSSIPIINLKIEKEGNIQFDYLSKLPKVNNIPPLNNIDLEAKFLQHTESNHKEADDILHGQTPSEIEGLKIKLSYQNEKRDNFVDIFKVINLNMVKQ